MRELDMVSVVRLAIGFLLACALVFVVEWFAWLQGEPMPIWGLILAGLLGLHLGMGHKQ